MLEQHTQEIVTAVIWLGVSAAWLCFALMGLAGLAVFGFAIERSLTWFVSTHGLLDAIYRIMVLKKDGIDVVEHFKQERERALREWVKQDEGRR